MKARNKGGVLLFSILLIISVVIALLAVSLREDPVKTALRENGGVLKTLFVLKKNSQVLFTDILLYYPPSKRGSLINIQGNVGAIFSSIERTDRIDAVYAERGINVYKSEIEKLVGQEIPFYVLMDLDEFSELTDLFGGMNIFIPAPIDIKGASGERWLLPSGAINLDGDKIRTYLVYTKDDDEASEVGDRRQNVVLAFFNAISRNAELFSNRKAFSEIAKRIDSNLERRSLQNLLREIAAIDAERIETQLVDGAERTVDGQTLVFPLLEGIFLKDAVKQNISQLVADGGQNVRSRYTLQILNGTISQGLAKRTRDLLASNYDVIEYGNAERNDYERTVILDHIGNDSIASLLGDFIRCENIEADDESSTTADFTIILGNDFDGRYVRKIGG